MAKRGSDRRTAPRASLRNKVELQYDNQIFPARLVDLSVKGAFVETEQSLPLQAQCCLFFTLPGGYRVNAASIVCYQQSGVGIGVEFRHLKPADRAAIEACVTKLY